MCAICGVVSKDMLNSQEKDLISQMSMKMALRGPDSHGTFISDHVALAHQRLSILDLNTGSQPLYADNGNCVIVYNGEVYNYQDIKNELETSGVLFKTQTDTEVVLQAYLKYGMEGCLDKLEGMYAFAIYDKQSNKLYIARDRFGEKPLYYYHKNNIFWFASELKALRMTEEHFEIDKSALNLFLSLSYIPAPFSIYEGVKKVIPGHYIEINDDLNIKDHEYYSVVDEIKETRNDCDAIKEELNQLLRQSVRKRMMADVPLGAFLSGGIDSSIVCCLMNETSDKAVNTFSIGYKEKEYDESQRAQILSAHIMSNHTQHELDYKDVMDVLKEIILYYDEPFSDSSAIPSYYVAKLASEKVKVVLTGDCADELFGGYEKYLANYYIEKYNKFPKAFRKLFEMMVGFCPESPITSGLLRKIRKVITNAKAEEFDLYYNLVCMGFNENDRRSLLKENCFVDVKSWYHERYDRLPSTLTFFQKEQVLDIQSVLEGDMFTKVDRACMHCSLENRAPFIDRKIVHLALNISDSLKINGKITKYILKEAFCDLLPPETLSFGKSGFGVPVEYWIRNELREEIKDLLSKNFIEKQGIFQYDFVSKTLSEHLSGKRNHKGYLWNLYVFQTWYKNVYQNK